MKNIIFLNSRKQIWGAERAALFWSIPGDTASLRHCLNLTIGNLGVDLVYIFDEVLVSKSEPNLSLRDWGFDVISHDQYTIFLNLFKVKGKSLQEPVH